MKSKIRFRELSASPRDFLHELADPALMRVRNLPIDVAETLRGEQVERLERNIAVLRAKQEEFNRRMDQYVANLRRLIASLRKRLSGAGDGEVDGLPGGDPAPGTVVTCPRCGEERRFSGLTVLFARESEDAIENPTQCYVNDSGRIKKGVFFCEGCGSDAMTIRTG